MLKIVPDPPHHHRSLDSLLMLATHDWLGSDVAQQRPADSLQR
ncbi:hypothetical protein ACQKO7_21340 [Pseudomonas putida]|nr:hypothetical protein [Pseudomonas putida]